MLLLVEIHDYLSLKKDVANQRNDLEIYSSYTDINKEIIRLQKEINNQISSKNCEIVGCPKNVLKS